MYRCGDSYYSVHFWDYVPLTVKQDDVDAGCPWDGTCNPDTQCDKVVYINHV